MKKKNSSSKVEMNKNNITTQNCNKVDGIQNKIDTIEYGKEYCKKTLENNIKETKN